MDNHIRGVQQRDEAHALVAQGHGGADCADAADPVRVARYYLQGEQSTHGKTDNDNLFHL